MRFAKLVTFSGLVAASLALGSAVAQTPKATEKLTIIKGVTSQQLDSVGDGGKKVFFKEFTTTEKADAQLTCGLFRIEKGDPSSHKYEFSVVQLITDGSITMTEASTKTSFVATKGDLVIITKGADVTFSAEDAGSTFFCNQSAPFH